MGPLLVKAIINFGKARAEAENDGTKPPHIGHGIGLSVGLFLIIIVTSIGQHQVAQAYISLYASLLITLAYFSSSGVRCPRGS